MNSLNIRDLQLALQAANLTWHTTILELCKDGILIKVSAVANGCDWAGSLIVPWEEMAMSQLGAPETLRRSIALASDRLRVAMPEDEAEKTNPLPDKRRFLII